jgi:hypothetical protein
MMAVIRIRVREACAIRAGLVLVGVFTSACSSSKTTPSQPSRASAVPVLQLWGDMTPVVSVKELMRDLIDPASDYVFRKSSVFACRSCTARTPTARVRSGRT